MYLLPEPIHNIAIDDVLDAIRLPFRASRERRRNAIFDGSSDCGMQSAQWDCSRCRYWIL
jgi:hypothetical protein